MFTHFQNSSRCCWSCCCCLSFLSEKHTQQALEWKWMEEEEERIMGKMKKGIFTMKTTLNFSFTQKTLENYGRYRKNLFKRNFVAAKQSKSFFDKQTWIKEERKVFNSFPCYWFMEPKISYQTLSYQRTFVYPMSSFETSNFIPIRCP